ncbi:transposable element Tc3 transposase [Trichonephila clavipes]|nr:transposable element Tc3 transposase [Trichonephila clavipes]
MIQYSPENSAHDNPTIRITRPTKTLCPMQKLSLLSQLMKKMPENDEGVNVEGIARTLKTSRSKGLKVVSISNKVCYTVLDLLFLHRLRDIAATSRIHCQVIYSQFGLAIHQDDHQARRRFVEWAQNEIAVVPDFHKRILFSDEAHFWLNGYVNKQNCRIWSEANPQVYVETPLHPEKLIVWCALWAGGINGPYFFKNDEGHNELWFQQDGATCHTARATIDLLKDTFGDRLISRFGPVNWLPRSCDLTPLDYFLWGYVKSLVYADKPQTLDHLEDNIRRVIADIRPQMLEKVIENWTTSEPAVAVLCQKSYLKCNATRLSFE